MVVDEAHCIPRWKDSFRKTYGRIGSFRAYLPHKVPFIACTATATPEDVRIISEILQLGADTDIINRGNHRPNLIWEVRRMKGAETSLEDVDFMVPDGATHADDIEQQLLFANKLVTTHNLAHRLRQRLPEHLRDCIEIYHSLRTVHQRAWTMYNFERGKTRIIVCSEAIAMGCDFRSITRVVQFMVTDSLTTWIQRGGRGGRNPELTCRCILLVQPSVFQLVKPRKKRKKKVEKFEDDYAGPLPDSASQPSLAALETAPEVHADNDQVAEADDDLATPEEDEEDDEIVMVDIEHEDGLPENAASAVPAVANAASRPAAVAEPDTVHMEAPAKSKTKATLREARVYAKKIPKDLRAFISTTDCRNSVIDATYMNPGHPEAPSGCCDLCIGRKDARTTSALAEAEVDKQNAASHPAPASLASGTQPRKEPGAGDRRGAQLEAARAVVSTWRYTAWKRDMRWSTLGEAAILSDSDLQTVSKKRRIRSVEALRSAVPNWAQHAKYEASLLAVLSTIAADEDTARAAAQRQREEERASAQQAKDAARQQERLERESLRQATRGPTKAAIRQAERDAQASAGIRLRGRPTKVELARRAQAMAGSDGTQSSGVEAPQRGPTHGDVRGDNRTAPATLSTPPMTPASRVPAALQLPTRQAGPAIQKTPVRAADAVLLTPETQQGIHRRRLAFHFDSSPNPSSTPGRGTPSNFVVVPLALGQPRQVLGDLNGRKKHERAEDMAEPEGTSAAKRIRTDDM